MCSLPLSAEEQWEDSQAIVRDGDGDSDDHNDNHSGVDRDCKDADDGNDSVDECGPLASFTLTDQMQRFIHQIQKRRSDLDLSRVTATVLLIKCSLHAWSGLGSFHSDSSGRRQMLFVHILYSLQRLSY